ncbi:MAG TPA: Rpp14/Pop5 family protein [Candidatus Thermoplasmatota archaeon]|nr:Rpp14/Pop5 family protein [Candidatus Thermoplasmatota archaeon]
MARDFRPRYILFRISGEKSLFPISRNSMIFALRSYAERFFSCSLKEKKIYLTRFNGWKGIVRCKHTEKQNTINLLQSITQINGKSVVIQTIATSGTIKSLVQKHDKEPILSK